MFLWRPPQGRLLLLRQPDKSQVFGVSRENYLHTIETDSIITTFNFVFRSERNFGANLLLKINFIMFSFFSADVTKSLRT